jgi:hypothetical protein
MYFRDFPMFLYDFRMDGNKRKTAIVKDITRNIRIRKEVLANVTLYDEYDIVDGETPEIIAEKFYGTPEYHWIVMLTNEKFDYLSDFPLEETYLQRHIETKYNPNYYSKDWRILPDQKDTIECTVYKASDAYSRIIFDYRYFVTNTMWNIKGSFDNGEVIDYTYNLADGVMTLDPITQKITIKTDRIWNGNPVGDLVSSSWGREHDPVQFLHGDHVVEPDNTNPNIFAVTGDESERKINDKKRRIKLISPDLIETIITNYEELLK